MEARILRIRNQNEAAHQIQKVGAYPKSVPIMSPKTVVRTIKLTNINATACNILKQEMLSLDGDVAVSKDVISKNQKASDCLIFGTIAQLEKLCSKLKKQPFGLDKIGAVIKDTLDNYQKENFTVTARRYLIRCHKKTRIMGVLNVTPDSFSDGGRFYDLESAIEGGLSLAGEGADIIDVGGESTRPGSRPVGSKEQIRRVVPVIKRLSKRVKIPLSIDTQRADVARAALDAGAAIVNDISGLTYDKKIAKVAADYKAGLVLMHMKGTPRTMQRNPSYGCLIGDITKYLKVSINKALDAGVGKKQIMIDPGIGFGKTTEHNLQIIKHLSEFKSLGYPLLIGTSRKSVIGNVLNVPVDNRLMGTAATVVYAILEGANIIRVHDVKETKQLIKMTGAIEKVKV